MNYDFSLMTWYTKQQ